MTLGYGGFTRGRQGLQPRYADPESAVLALDDLPQHGCTGYRITPRQSWVAILGLMLSNFY